MYLFQEADKADLVQIARLEQSIFTDPWSLKSLEGTFTQPQAFMTVAKEHGRVRGYVIIYYVLDEGEIARIAVEDSKRQEGVGSKLFEKACELCLQRNLHRIILDVRVGNEAALSFYRRHGFTEDGVRKGFYELPREDALLMSRELS